MTTITATEMQNNFGKYLNDVQHGDKIIILKNGKEAAILISYGESVSFLTDSLVGVLKNDYSEDAIREEKLKKYTD